MLAALHQHWQSILIKTTTAGWGFYVAVILIIIYMGICIKNMADKHALDLGFLAL